MTVVVSGGSGLVGSHVIAALRARGERVRALARPRALAAVERLGAEPVTGDVTDPAAWRAACDVAGGVRGIVHAAALVQRPASWSAHVAVNVAGARLAAEAARTAGARLVHVSSVSVYGGSGALAPRGESVTEDAPWRDLHPSDFYARSKRLAEEAVQAVAAGGGLAAIAIRPNVIYGERDRLFTRMVLRLLRLRLLPQLGPGTNRLSCVYAGNVVAAIMAALEAPLGGFHTFNVTSDAGPRLTQREFVDAFARELGVRLVRLPVPRTAAAGLLAAVGALTPGRRSVARVAARFATGDNPYSSERARRVLGWQPPFTSADGIRRTVAWFRESETPER